MSRFVKVWWRNHQKRTKGSKKTLFSSTYHTLPHDRGGPGQQAWCRWKAFELGHNLWWCAGTGLHSAIRQAPKTITLEPPKITNPHGISPLFIFSQIGPRHSFSREILVQMSGRMSILDEGVQRYGIVRRLPVRKIGKKVFEIFLSISTDF